MTVDLQIPSLNCKRVPFFFFFFFVNLTSGRGRGESKFHRALLDKMVKSCLHNLYDSIFVLLSR